MRTLIATAALVIISSAPAVAQETPASPSPTPSAAQGVEIPDFATKSWIVADAESGDVLAGQNPDEQLPMASTLKTLTALTLLPRLQYDSTYEARATETLTEGAHVGVLAGNHYTVAELLHGMLMRSGNDAAVALADAYGYQRTLDAMNAEAQRIGASSTVAMSPNGLDKPGQVSTAADLAQIYRVAMRDERLQEILTAKQFDFPGQPPKDPTKPRADFTIFNNDSLLNSDYPGFMGGKSGFTSQAGRTYVAGADQNGRKLVVALLGIGGGTTQTARQLLDWSFANVDRMTPIAQLPAVTGESDITAAPAGVADPEDIAPTPTDEQAQLAAASVAEAAVRTAGEALAGAPTSVDPQEAAQSAIDAAQQAGSTAASVGTGLSADMIVAGLQSPPFAGAPVEDQPAGRGLFSTVLIGLFKAMMWLLLFLGIAVVLLRIRAVRRINRRRAEQERMRTRATGTPAADSTPRRVPSRTG